VHAEHGLLDVINPLPFSKSQHSPHRHGGIGTIVS